MTVWSGPFVNDGASSTTLTVIVNVWDAEVSAPPFAVPPLSLRLTVIVADPLAGLALMWWTERLGGWIIALAMAGSFIFGFLNHFVFASPDHVAHVASAWRPLFTATAVLLALTEALGFTLALRVVQKSENV